MACVRAANAELAKAYIGACRVDVQALKPGNVSLQSPGHDMRAADFLRSAEVSAPWLAAPDLGLGERIYRAVEASRVAVNCNTNLGIVLLSAPLMQAMLAEKKAGLRERVRDVLRTANSGDTDWTYRAIRLASPGGLGRAERYDVRQAPDVSLQTAMREAAHRDRIAFQYASGFNDVFDYALPKLREGLARWRDECWAATAVFIGLLRRFPDSHIQRKQGADVAREVSSKAARLEAELAQCASPETCTESLLAADREFKAAGINPGATADLTVATLLAWRLDRLLNTARTDAPSASSARSTTHGHEARDHQLTF